MARRTNPEHDAQNDEQIVLRKQDILLLRDALLISRIRYHAPYTDVTKRIKRINALIKKATKIAVSIFINASTKKLLETGTNNTLEEIVPRICTANAIRSEEALEPNIWLTKQRGPI